jgi:hypothetical protein
MLFYTALATSLIINLLLIWYVIRLLRKFFFISENLADLYLSTKAFSLFVSSMYSMDSYYGEPMIQELMGRIREVNEEVEAFRDIFEYTIDEEYEEELNDHEDEAETRI